MRFAAVVTAARRKLFISFNRFNLFSRPTSICAKRLFQGLTRLHRRASITLGQRREASRRARNGIAFERSQARRGEDEEEEAGDEDGDRNTQDEGAWHVHIVPLKAFGPRRRPLTI